MTETTILREKVLPKLRALGHFEKIPGSPFNVGLPDVMGVIGGIAVVFEAKKWLNRKPTDLQREKLLRWSANNALAFLLVFPKDGQDHYRVVVPSVLGGAAERMVDLVVKELKAELVRPLEDFMA